MENRIAGSAVADRQPAQQEEQTRRKRKNGSDHARPRYFLPKAGSSLKSPELGQELPTEGEALVRSFQSNQHFFVLTVWRADAEQNGGNPVIMKQAVVDSRAE